MNQKNLGYALSFLGYLILSYFHFIEKNYVAAFTAWVLFLILKLIIKPWREQSPLLFVVGLCFIFLELIVKTQWLAWPVDFYLTALFGFLLLRLMSRRNTPLKWSFAFSKKELLSILIINVPAIFILIWYFRLHPEVASMWPVPQMPLWLTPFVILLLAAINGLREEIFYRGFIQPTSAKTSPVWYMIALQALLFGFLHFTNSFPQGWVGVALTATWGAAIAIQYHIFRSISLAWVTHAMADAIMFAIIILVRSKVISI